MVYCGDNRVSFVHSKIDTLVATPDTLARVDINFHETFREAEPLGMGLNPHHYNYYYAHCPEGVTLTPTYNRVVYPQLYENTDLHIKGNNAWMKFEFVIHPGGDPEDILMTFEGADNVEVIQSLGLLIVTSSIGTYIFPKPTALKIDTVSGAVELGWQPDWDLSVEGDTVRFTNIGSYNPAEVLVFTLGEEPFSPVVSGDDNLEHSTYVGGSSWDEFNDVCSDEDGKVYVAGFSSSVDFPAEDGIYTEIQAVAGRRDVVVLKINDDMTLIWSTYYGGSSNDYASALGVDGFGNVFFAGYTTSTDFPTEFPSGAYRDETNLPALPTASPGDAFIVKLNSEGSSKLWATYYGTDINPSASIDEAYDLAIDADNSVYVVGTRAPGTQLRTLGGADNYTTGSGIIMKFFNSGQPDWATAFGSEYGTTVRSVSVDADGNQYYTGVTESGLQTENAEQGSLGGESDAFVSKFNSANSNVWTTYHGGNQIDIGHGIATDINGDVYVIGNTRSDSGFPLSDPPTLPNYYEGAYQGGASDFTVGDLFVSKYSSDGSLLISTYYGGTGGDEARNICADGSGRLYVTGITHSSDFPLITNPTGYYEQGFIGSTNVSDAFILVMDNNLTRLWTTFFGGGPIPGSTSGIDNGYGVSVYDGSKLYLVGTTSSSSSFPLVDFTNGNVDGVYNPILPGFPSGFLSRFDVSSLPLSVDEVNFDMDTEFSLYPNPASSMVRIGWESKDETVVILSVVDINGRVLEKARMSSHKGYNSGEIDINKYASGLYTVVLTCSQRVLKKKFIKM
jgi:hypothetical protein